MPILDDFDTQELTEAGVDMELMDPRGEPMWQDDNEKVPVTIRLLGRDSELFLKKQRAQVARRVQANRGRRNPQIQETEEAVADQVELLAAVTTGWSGIEDKSGPIPFNLANCKAVYHKYPWIREQVDNFVGDRANFTKSVSKGSGSSPDASSGLTAE